MYIGNQTKIGEPITYNVIRNQNKILTFKKKNVKGKNLKKML